MEDLDLVKLKASVEESAEGKTADQVAAELVPRELPMDIKYKDPTGVTHSATVLSKILSGSERINVGRMASAMLQSAWESTPASIREFCYTLAWLTSCLVDPPAWLLKWITEDEELLFSIYQEVLRHERRYFRGDADQGDASEADQRVSVTSKASAGPAKK